MQPGSGRTARRWDILAAAALAGWLVFDLLARPLFGTAGWPASAVDYRILYDDSRKVVETHTYPAGYPYPPPAVALQSVTAVLPFTAAATAWLVLTGLAAGACYVALARTLGLTRRPGVLVVLPVAHLVVAYYFQWDMRSLNCNLVVLAAILFGCSALVRDRAGAAGFWFALAVALKVFPVLVLPYLAWTRRWRALGWATGFSLVLWVIVPAVAFGAGGLRPVYAGWVGELTRATDPELKNHHPILISLDKATAHVAAGNAALAKGITLGVCAAWVLLGLAGAAASRRSHDAASTLAHVSLLVIGPVAVNPYLEPYHLVPLVIPALLLLAAAANSTYPTHARVVAAVGFVVGFAVLKVSSPWPLRGLLVNVQALILCAVAVWTVWAARSTNPSEPTGDPRPAHGWFRGLFRRAAARRTPA